MQRQRDKPLSDARLIATLTITTIICITMVAIYIAIA